VGIVECMKAGTRKIKCFFLFFNKSITLLKVKFVITVTPLSCLNLKTIFDTFASGRFIVLYVRSTIFLCCYAVAKFSNNFPSAAQLFHMDHATC